MLGCLEPGREYSQVREAQMSLWPGRGYAKGCSVFREWPGPYLSCSPTLRLQCYRTFAQLCEDRCVGMPPAGGHLVADWAASGTGSSTGHGHLEARSHC